MEREILSKAERKRGRKSFLQSHILVKEVVLDHSPTKDSTWCPLASSTKSKSIEKIHVADLNIINKKINEEHATR
ncbi:hypothetical protein PanWU01x14_011940, partial [Parasponia andersonii]